MATQKIPDREIRDERFDYLSKLEFESVGSHSTSALSAFFEAIRDTWAQRGMLGLLVRRDLKSKYKDSVLGFVWSLIRPLTQLLIYYIVMGKFLGAARGIPEFAIYIYCGLTAYSLFSEIISSGTGSIVGNSGLIKKIYLTREIFPLASVGSALFNFLIQLLILFSATLVLGQFPWTPQILFIIPAIFIILIYGTALALFLGSINVYMRDIQYLVEVGLMILLWGSPIVYSLSMVNEVVKNTLLRELYINNPLTLAVLGFQRAVWMGGNGVVIYPHHQLLRMIIAGAIGLVVLFFCQRVFSRLQGNFAQEL